MRKIINIDNKDYDVDYYYDDIGNLRIYTVVYDGLYIDYSFPPKTNLIKREEARELYRKVWKELNKV